MDDSTGSGKCNATLSTSCVSGNYLMLSACRYKWLTPVIYCTKCCSEMQQIDQYRQFQVYITHRFMKVLELSNQFCDKCQIIFIYICYKYMLEEYICTYDDMTTTAKVITQTIGLFLRLNVLSVMCGVQRYNKNRYWYRGMWWKVVVSKVLVFVWFRR